MRQLIANLFISLDGFASGKGEAPYFGYFGAELWTGVRENLDRPQSLIMGRVTYQALAAFSAGATDEVSLKMNAVSKLVFPGNYKNHCSGPTRVSYEAIWQTKLVD